MNHVIIISNHDRRKHVQSIHDIYLGRSTLAERKLDPALFGAAAPRIILSDSMREAIVAVARATAENVPLVNSCGAPNSIAVLSGMPMTRRVMSVTSDFSLLDVLAKHEPDGGTALHYAALADNVSLAKAAILAGVDVNGQDSYGNTPLMYAAAAQAANMVMHLLAAGADLMLANHQDAAPCESSISPDLSKINLSAALAKTSGAKSGGSKKKM